MTQSSRCVVKGSDNCAFSLEQVSAAVTLSGCATLDKYQNHHGDDRCQVPSNDDVTAGRRSPSGLIKANSENRPGRSLGGHPSLQYVVVTNNSRRLLAEHRRMTRLTASWFQGAGISMRTSVYNVHASWSNGARQVHKTLVGNRCGICRFCNDL